MSAPTLGEWLEQGPWGLAMSSGFFGFFAHAGMVAALEDAGLMRPVALSGSSAGALTAALWASGRSGEDIGEELASLRREEFWDPAPGLGLLRGQRFADRLHKALRVHDFQRCRAPLALSVHALQPWRTEIIAAGPLVPAVVASCAVPGLFQPVTLNSRRFVDGGVSDRPGVAGMRATHRVLYHHLASRSPWRRVGSASMAIPDRPGLTALVIERITRLGPFKLHLGPIAFQQAREATRRALDQPLLLGVARVVAPEL